MKKLLSFILAIVMMLALAAPAAAYGEPDNRGADGYGSQPGMVFGNPNAEGLAEGFDEPQLGNPLPDDGPSGFADELIGQYKDALWGISLDAAQQAALDAAMGSLHDDLSDPGRYVADVLFGLFFELTDDNGDTIPNPLASAVAQMGDEGFVRLLYEMLLKYPASPDLDVGVAWLVGELGRAADDPDRLSRQAVFNMLTDVGGAFEARFAAAGYTGFYDDSMRAVRDTYWHALGWRHIGAGFGYWVGRMAAGRTHVGIMADFLFIAIDGDYGQLTDRQFTIVLYNACGSCGWPGVSIYDRFFEPYLRRLEGGEFNNNPVHPRWGMVEAFLTKEGYGYVFN